MDASAALLAAAVRIGVLGVLPLDAAVACYPLRFGGAGGAQCFALTLLAAAATVPMAGALLATLA